MERMDLALMVLQLRELRGWSQTKLAHEAGLAPATLSRVLTGDRSLRMTHAVALARALGVTVVELTTGTTAEGVVSEWVPRSEYDSLDQARAGAEQELVLAQAEHEAQRAEAAALKRSVGQLSSRVEELERSERRLRGEAAQAEALSLANGEQRREVHELRGSLARQAAKERRLHQVAVDQTNLANNNYQAWRFAHQRIEALERDLRRAKGDSVATGIIAASLAGIAGAMLASPAETPKRGRRSRP